MAANPFAQGIFNAVKDAMGLMDDYNKVSDVGAQGTGSESQEEYQSKFSDEEIRQLTKSWKDTYSVYYGDVERHQKLAYDYWLGKHKQDSLEDIAGYNLVDNLIFEAVETFLPIANRANPDPLVDGGDDPLAIQAAKDAKDFLVDWADTQKLRMKLKKGTRNWVLKLLGVWKMSYNHLTDSFDLEVVDPKNLILDKDGHWDESGLFTGDYIGEKKKKAASVLSQMFPKKREAIMNYAKGKRGTKLEFIEWWYRGTDVFYTLDTMVLGKFKNPNWNYDQEAEVGEDGQETTPAIQGSNHLFGTKSPMAPYIGLVVFNTAQGPHDETGLVLQNIPMQDMVNKRFRQIDRNADSQNNGALASGDAFTKEQAAEASTFLRKGGTVWVPNGDVNAAWKRDAAPPLAGDVFNQLRDSREELRNIFGTSGSTPQGIQDEKSVRGKIMVQQSDTSRIGGGVTEYIEQCADTIYNFAIQFEMVYHDRPWPELQVTVKEGSLIPKDPLTRRNEAMDLWTANAIGLPELYERLEFADPMDSAQKTLMWQMVAKGALPPQALFPDFMANQAQGAIGVGGPAVNPNQQEDTTPPPPGSEPAIQQQSQQLLASVPTQQI